MNNNNIPRDNSSSVQWMTKRKKKVSKRETIKRRKVSGEPHIDHVGRPRSGVLTGPDCRCKRLQCFQRLSAEQRQEILKIFYKYESKNDQDAHLQGLISYKSVQQRRPRLNRNEEDDSFSHDLAYYYKVRTNNEEIPICARAFMSLHGITRGRLRTIQAKVSSGQLPKDGRGKHATRPHAVPPPVLELIKTHIKSFKGRQSHYSLRDNPNVVYLPEDLSVKKMHELFTKEIQINVSYIVYYSVFTKHFNIKFGLPRSDTCSICDELNLKILSETDATRKNELNIQKTLHLQKAKKFRELKNTYKEKAKRGECMLLSFDYMQNLPLPHIKTSDVFYSRQMWYYVFGIHNLSNNDATMYCYTEVTGRKGASDVTSLLLHYLNNNDITSENLVLLSDGCSGQNKNHIMVYFQYFLVYVLKLFKTVKHIFPVRGHTYLPNDADFALIGKKKGVCSPEIPADWDKIIEAARKYPTPFKVVSATQDLFFNMKEAMAPYFLKLPRPALRLRQVRIITTNEKYQHIKVKESFSGPSTRCEIRKKVRLPSELVLNPLYVEPIKMTAGKIANLLNLSKYLSKPENRDFYRQICSECDDDFVDVDNEVDEDDNSDGCE